MSVNPIRHSRPPLRIAKKNVISYKHPQYSHISRKQSIFVLKNEITIRVPRSTKAYITKNVLLTKKYIFFLYSERHTIINSFNTSKCS